MSHLRQAVVIHVLAERDSPVTDRHACYWADEIAGNELAPVRRETADA